ncbi:DUF2007 domain-containing protein [Plebeiibacterium sediminum]|uniref:DUF2007 domain-containing protein n=1 Tax=Plebeiibacterium sediminum TaxID=2992112 RepID=A0AAE3M2I3_9BACT|nr:DUF2007 domain-containing protein [Plebeiobacterium sediminum]MCW3785766.1 DUF2007 domain-containing protein [Plebeiobacterium sediminum]
MDNQKIIYRSTYPHDAHMVKTYLQSEGIHSVIIDELTAQVNNFYSNAIGGVKLLVNENDYSAGINVLQKGGYISDGNEQENIPVETVYLTASTNKKACPFCHSENIGRKKELNIVAVIVYVILSILFPIFKRNYKCFDCNKEWKYVKK